MREEGILIGKLQYIVSVQKKVFLLWFLISIQKIRRTNNKSYQWSFVIYGIGRKLLLLWANRLLPPLKRMLDRHKAARLIAPKRKQSLHLDVVHKWKTSTGTVPSMFIIVYIYIFFSEQYRMFMSAFSVI